MIKEINEQEFKEITKEGFAIVDVYGNNCGPCLGLAKTLEEVDFDFPFVNIYKLNADENKEFCKEHRIMGLPTIFFMSEGEIVKRELGALSNDQIMEIAGEYLY